MKIKLKKRTISYLIGASLIAGIAAGRMPSPMIVFPETVSLHDEILTVSAKVYNPDESKQILKTDLVSRGYVPVEITIMNPGEHTYGISIASTGLDLATPEQIAWKESARGIPRGVVLKILSIFFWPFTIPSTIDTIYSIKKHASTVSVLTAKGLKEAEEIVLPYSLVKRVLYVPEDSFNKTFSVSLQNLHTEEQVVIPVVAS